MNIFLTMTDTTKTVIEEAAGAPSHEARLDWAELAAVCLCLLFFLEGLIFIPYVGLQNDELLFAEALYPPVAAAHSVRVAGQQVPTMLMSYVGTLKSWLYTPLFGVWPPSPWSVRIPVLLLGALTVGLFFSLVRSACGSRAAVVVAALLATDATFVLTTCLDWGPVALQHFLLVAGLLLLWRFHATGRLFRLGAGFFCFGLALWDKALFSWSLAALVVAALVVFPRETLGHLRPRKLAVAVLGFALGAAPLIVYNTTQRLITFRESATFTTDGLGQKAAVLRGSLEGASLFGYVVREDMPLQPGKPRNPLEALSVELSDSLGERRTGLLGLASILAVALLPWLWVTPARRPMLFALVFLGVAWIQMALTKGAGTGAHHTVLLWPFPHLLAGAALARASLARRRAGLAALVVVVALVCGANAAVLNQHLAQLIERGTTTIWTDAITPLAAYLRDAGASRIYVMDWGMMNVLRALEEGRLPLDIGSDPVAKESPAAGDRELALRMLATPGALFVGHTEGNEIMSGVSARMEALASSAGYQKQVVRVIEDRAGRPVFEVYRWKTTAAPAPRS
jgi:4-amino-4-deoxy-L-arabinose transferase-like glycosyltransferase